LADGAPPSRTAAADVGLRSLDATGTNIIELFRAHVEQTGLAPATIE
jgi:hypothetical protein